MIFLKLLVAGHLTICLTRTIGPFWGRPWPNWRLVVATEATQIVGTIAAVQGWGMAPIGWEIALAVWGYALVWFVINDLAKRAAYRLVRPADAPAPRPVRPLGPGPLALG